jgi:ubiquinone/menaquinone biosynthesis C-methylase UbiE
MKILSSIQSLLGKPSPPVEKPVIEAYDAWSGTYDEQPGNLMLHLDDVIFSTLFREINIAGKHVADIGCGTGRHWPMIYSRSPASLTGFDVSMGMLNKLTQKFPNAVVRHITNDFLEDVPATSVDCIISTLTIAHLSNIDEAISAWARILKPGGDVIITDFHPVILASGGKRSFKVGTQQLFVKNYVHPVSEVKNISIGNGFSIVKEEERIIDESVKHFYEAQGALNVFEKYRGMAVIYGLYLKK